LISQTHALGGVIKTILVSTICVSFISKLFVSVS